MKLLNPKIRQKFAESLKAVLPVVGIVIVLSFTIAPITSSILLCFLVGAVMVMAGMMFFTLGAEMSMTPMGEKVGARMTQSKNILLIVVLSFLLGVVITISEPDLQVLATQVPSVPNMTLILAVAVGVGIFLVIALLRMLIGVALPPLLTFFYIAVFVLAFLVPENFRAVAFDSGGVTTGPMTVPFIMALGVGIASIRNDHHAADDSFGLVALCSIGPILAVMVLGLIYKPTNADYQPVAIPEISDSVELAQLLPWAAGLYERNRTRITSHCIVFRSVPDICPAAVGEDTGEDPDRAGVYLYRSGIVSDRRKCGLYASR